jgi:3-methyladenine DNA glycosylase AlkD
MKFPDAMNQLKSLGTAQNRKVYGRHGVGGDMFGVSYANLNSLKKKIRTDQELARLLWESGNHDARVLATMIADAGALDLKTVNAWLKDLDSYVITDAFAGMVGRSCFAHKKMAQWTRSGNEWTARAGWHLLAKAAMAADDLPDDFFEAQLAEIESRIHQSKNRVRDAMLNALIAIGIRNGRLEKKAIAAAGRIGTVEVDHGETGCKTPDPIPYIKRARARQKKRAKKT